MSDAHSISLRGGPRRASRVVLVLHGGSERDAMATTRWQLSYLRMFDMYDGLRKRLYAPTRAATRYGGNESMRCCGYLCSVGHTMPLTERNLAATWP